MTAIANLLRPFSALLAGRSVSVIGPGVGGNVGREATAEVLNKEESDVIFWVGSHDEDITADRELQGLFANLGSALAKDGLLLIVYKNTACCGSTGAIPGFSGAFQAGVALGSALVRASLEHVERYYIFPDHDEPSVLLCESAFNTPGFEVDNLIAPHFRVAHGGAATGSLLLIASRCRIDPVPPGSLAFSFNRGRRERFNKMNVFHKTDGGAIMVSHVPSDVEEFTCEKCHGDNADGESDPAMSIKQDLSAEQYLPGRLYSLVLHDILSHPGWSVNDVRKWAEPWLALLKNKAADGWQWLDGRYVDLTPFNLLLHDGVLSAIDQEWIIQEPVAVNYVLFRGLYHCLARVTTARKPTANTPVNLFGLTLAVLEGMVEGPAALLTEFLALEQRYFGSVFPGETMTPGDLDLPIVSESNEHPGDDGRAGGDEHPYTAAPRRLYALKNLNVQVFVETSTADFSEERSTWLPIGLSLERKVYTLRLTHFTPEATRLRIDPSDHSGILLIHSLNLRTASGVELFHWTPYSRSEVQLNGIVILNAAPMLPEPVTILLNHDPSMVFPMGLHFHDIPSGPVELELELSALSEPLSETILATLRQLSEQTP